MIPLLIKIVRMLRNFNINQCIKVLFLLKIYSMENSMGVNAIYVSNNIGKHIHQSYQFKIVNTATSSYPCLIERSQPTHYPLGTLPVLKVPDLFIGL